MIDERPFRGRVAVRFTRRDDGGLRATCEAVPGFLLSGLDPRAVMDDVIPALELLMKENLDLSVRVSPLGYGLYEMREEETTKTFHWPDNPEYVQEYVVEKLAA